MAVQACAWAVEGAAVEWREGALSVSARQVPLNALLSEVAERTGIELSLNGDLGEPVSVHFDGVGLREGLGQILMSVSVSYALVEYHSGDAAQPSIALLVSRRTPQAAQGTGFLDPVIPPQMLEQFKAVREAAPAQPMPREPAQAGPGVEGVTSLDMIRTLRARLGTGPSPRPQAGAPEAGGGNAQAPTASQKTAPAGPPPPAASSLGGTQPFSMEGAKAFGSAPAARP